MSAEEMTFEMKSGGTRLRLSDRRIENTDYHRSVFAVVTLEAYGLRAQKLVDFFFAESLFELFEDMAKDWKGWEGEKTAATIERELTFCCTSDKLGHSFIKVILFDYNHYWKAEARFEIESGQYDVIAKQLKSFLSIEQS